MERMKVRYPPPEYELFFEVYNGTGSNHRRSADCIAVGTYPSRGLPIIGFEFKDSRSDWLRELKNPDKAEVIHGYCDFWNLVVSDKDIVGPGELPKGWGLIIPRGDGLVAKVDAEKNEGAIPRVSRGFLAAIIRRAGEAARDAAKISRLPESIQAEVEKRVTQEVAWRTEYSTKDHERLLARYKELEDRVNEFTRTTGISLENPDRTWGSVPNYAEIAKAVNIVAKMNRTHISEFSHALKLLCGHAEDLGRDAEHLKSLLGAMDTKELEELTVTEPATIPV